MTLVDGIARKLDDAGVGKYRDDGSAYVDTEVGITDTAVIPGPDQLIVLTLYPGPEVDAGNPWRNPRLQVRTRGTSDPRVGRALNDACDQVLHALGPVTLTDPDSTRLTDCYALQDGAQSLGQDQQGRWEFTRNYQLSTAG